MVHLGKNGGRWCHAHTYSVAHTHAYTYTHMREATNTTYDVATNIYVTHCTIKLFIFVSGLPFVCVCAWVYTWNFEAIRVELFGSSFENLEWKGNYVKREGKIQTGELNGFLCSYYSHGCISNPSNIVEELWNRKVSLLPVFSIYSKFTEKNFFFKEN